MTERIPYKYFNQTDHRDVLKHRAFLAFQKFLTESLPNLPHHPFLPQNTDYL